MMTRPAAIEFESCASILEWLNSHPKCDDRWEVFAQVPLFEVVSAWVAHGGDVNATIGQGLCKCSYFDETWLHTACVLSDEKSIEFLMDHGADWTLMTKESRFSCMEMLFLGLDFVTELEPEQNGTRIFSALKMLHSKGVDVNHAGENEYIRSPFSMALSCYSQYQWAMANHPEEQAVFFNILDFLVEHGLDWGPEKKEGSEAVHPGHAFILNPDHLIVRHADETLLKWAYLNHQRELDERQDPFYELPPHLKTWWEAWKLSQKEQRVLQTAIEALASSRVQKKKPLGM